MSTVASADLLLEDLPPEAQKGDVPDSLLEELSALAFATDSLPERSILLYRHLRKMIGQPKLLSVLAGIQLLAEEGEPAGARLLAAALDASTPGARLVPRIHSFSSCRRTRLRMVCGDPAGALLSDWERRLQEVIQRCEEQAERIVAATASPSGRPGSEPPYSLMRRSLRYLVAALHRGGELEPSDQALLADLARLEVDAYQERVSRLAEAVDPFRVSAVVRLLPLLSRADAEIRDLRDFIGWIQSGQMDKAFHQRLPRSYEVLDDRERAAFRQAIAATEDLAPLADVLTASADRPLPVPQLAGFLARLMALRHHMVVQELCDSELSLLAAARIVYRQHRGSELRLPLNGSMRRTVGSILEKSRHNDQLPDWPLDGFYLEDGALVLHLSSMSLSEGAWPDDLPAAGDLDRAAREPDEMTAQQQALRKQQDAAAVKRLVLSNLGAVSVMMGLLRNPKIIAIPGLVAEVAMRCRTVQILDMIANDRSLYTGYANKDVPRILVRHPCNIPIRTLRKFIHVKYIARVDLQRMAQDKAGIRDEVVQEIKAYLRSLI